MEENNVKVIASFAAAFALSFSLIISVISWRGKNAGARRVFIFEEYSAAEGVQEGVSQADRHRAHGMEARYIAKGSAQGDIKAYIDDILLGPITHGLCPLFAPGTRVLSCFVRGGVLYVNLSGALLNVNSRSSDIKTGIDLLKKNVMRNFADIKDVCVFVEGGEAFKSVI